MKKELFVYIILLEIGCLVYGNDYNLEFIKSFNNGTLTEGFYLRKTGEDDFSGNDITFNYNGDFYGYNNDSGRFMLFNEKFDIIGQAYIKYKGTSLKINWSGEKFSASGYSGHIFIFNKKCQLEADIKYKELDTTKGNSYFIVSSYYDEEINVLFFIDNNQNIYSVSNPSFDQEQNKKNYLDSLQTGMSFSREQDYDKKKVFIDGKKLYVNDKQFFWINPCINGKQYGLSDTNCTVWDNRMKIVTVDYKISDKEKFESVSIHPSGDIYILSMNWSTNKHNLYRIENTWDPAWRSKWYAEHNQQ